VRTIIVYVLTLTMGLVAAGVVAWLVGLAFPAARGWVFLILAVWWMWIGSKYAKARDQAHRN
jgi:membrane protein implicated in regulation of membrane protease activity